MQLHEVDYVGFHIRLPLKLFFSTSYTCLYASCLWTSYVEAHIVYFRSYRRFNVTHQCAFLSLGQQQKNFLIHATLDAYLDNLTTSSEADLHKGDKDFEWTGVK